eukprot:4385827-Ditylum_brightwellii.AAC.1
MMEKMDWMKEDVNNNKQNVANIRYGTVGGNNTGRSGRGGRGYYGRGEEAMEDTVEQGKWIQRVNDW